MSDQTAAGRPGGCRLPGRLRAWAGQLEEYCCYLLLLALVVTTSLQVFTRYILNSPLTWTEEVARMLFTWLIFLGSAFIVKHSSHIVIDVLTNALPAAPRRWLLLVSHLVTLTVLGLLAVKGIQLLVITGQSSSPALDIPWVYVYAAFPVGMLLMFVRYAAAFLCLLRGAAPAPPAAATDAPP